MDILLENLIVKTVTMIVVIVKVIAVNGEVGTEKVTAAEYRK
jgi:hypothetical protein